MLVFDIYIFVYLYMKTIKDYESYSVNPSVVLIADIKVINQVKKGEIKRMQDMDTGEETIIQEMGEHLIFEKDSREYRKVYVEALPTIANLSSAGLKVWCYVLARLIAKKDEIGINLDDCMEYTGYKTRANIYTGIINLLENKMLFKKVGSGVYFININIFFNGNRIK